MVGLNPARNLTQNPTWVIADTFHGLPLVPLFMLTSFLLRIWFRKAVTNVLDFKSFYRPFKTNELLHRLKLECVLCWIWTCVSDVEKAGPESPRKAKRAMLASVLLYQVLWPLQIRVEKCERVIRESTNSPKAKTFYNPLNCEKSAPIQKTLLFFIRVALSIAPPGAAVCGHAAAGKLFIAPVSWGWLSPCDLRGSRDCPGRWCLIGRQGKLRSTELHVGGQRGSSLLWAYICGSYVSFQMHFLVASYLSTGYWTCYFLKDIVCGSWLKSCCSVSLFFYLARILSYSLC